jgi:tetratricopeptide (TPR) repeat protein
VIGGVDAGRIAGMVESNHDQLARRGWIIPLALLALFLPAQSFAQHASSTFEDVASQASTARDQGDIPHAIALYQQAVQLNPGWPDGWWFLGSLQYGAGGYAPAVDALSRYIDLTPKAAPAFAMRGLCEFETGDYPQSLKDIQRGLALGAANQPRNEKILRYREATLLTRVGRFEDALRGFAFFAKSGEEPNPELLLALGLAGLRTPLLPAELRADQQDAYTNAGRAAFDFMKNDEDGARAEFQRLFARTPVPQNAHYFYGYLLYAKDPDLAAVEFKRELEVSPSNASAEVMLAWISLMGNRAAEALPHAEKAVADDATIPSAQLVLGRALTETGDAKAGLPHLEKVSLQQPEDLEVHLALARAYSEAGRKQDARRERLLCLEMTKNETIQAIHP